MEYILEFILEIIFELVFEASKSNRIPMAIRIILITIISLLFIGVIGLIFLLGILVLKKTLLGGVIIMLLGLFMLISAVIKFRKIYLVKKERN